MLKKTCNIVLHLAASVLIGTVLLMCVYMLPVDHIDANVKSSAYIIKTEGTYPDLSEHFTSRLDNYTDSIMMLEAANKPVISPLIDAMNSPRGAIAEEQSGVPVTVNMYLIIINVKLFT